MASEPLPVTTGEMTDDRRKTVTFRVMGGSLGIIAAPPLVLRTPEKRGEFARLFMEACRRADGEPPVTESRPAAPGEPAPSTGERIFHDPVCKCGHKKGLHAGAAADGRCVKRSCGCGKYARGTGLSGKDPETGEPLYTMTDALRDMHLPEDDSPFADRHHDPAVAWAAGDDTAYGPNGGDRDVQ